jgi:hypothetical protein
MRDITSYGGGYRKMSDFEGSQAVPVVILEGVDRRKGEVLARGK